MPKALNHPLSKPIPVAVVAVKSAGRFKLALVPNRMPAGLIKYKLELPPVIWRMPLIMEGSPPTTRPRILRVLESDMKLAI